MQTKNTKYHILKFHFYLKVHICITILLVWAIFLLHILIIMIEAWRLYIVHKETMKNIAIIHGDVGIITNNFSSMYN